LNPSIVLPRGSHSFKFQLKIVYPQGQWAAWDIAILACDGDHPYFTAAAVNIKRWIKVVADKLRPLWPEAIAI
jgi:hypothetical protein